MTPPPRATSRATPAGPVRTRYGRAALVVVVLAVVSCGGELGPSRNGAAAGGTLVPIGAGLEGPPGLKASVYATGLSNSAALAIDSQSRLWVATAGYEDQASDGVYMVERPGAAPVQVLSDLHTPLGLTWYGDTLFVSSMGGVEAYRALQDTRFGEHRSVLSWPVPVGENNNIVLAPDGRLLVGISAPCDHCRPTSPWSAAIVSFRPDGGDLRIFASGIRAPFGLTYYPGSDDLFVSMDQRDDLGARTPGDWLSVVTQGEDWRFPDCYGQEGSSCTGVARPTAVLDRHGAAGGVAIVTGQLGETVGNSALVAEWALGKVQRVALNRTGTGFSGRVLPFVTGMKKPLPVLATSEGTVLIGDWKTGTIYRLSSH
jgi:glucose/arabinose dehydrogenase